MDADEVLDGAMMRAGYAGAKTRLLIVGVSGRSTRAAARAGARLPSDSADAGAEPQGNGGNRFVTNLAKPDYWPSHTRTGPRPTSWLA